VTLLQRLARRFGYDLVPRKKAKTPNAQLIAVLNHHRIDTVLDVGAMANQGGPIPLSADSGVSPLSDPDPDPDDHPDDGEE